MIGLSEPVASLQFPHLATSRGCAEWFREEKISSEQRFSGPQCFAGVRGERADDCCCCCDVLMAGLFILCREGSAALRVNWGPTLPC